MTDLEKRIKKDTRAWWITDSNYSKLLSLETLIMNIVKDETKELETQIEQKDKHIEWLENIVSDEDTMWWNNQLTIQKLQEQIEEMKRCEICEHSGTYLPICYSKEPCKNKDKFELRR